MANKYKDYEKCMMSFTVPNVVIKSHGGIKNGRYSKMRVLVSIKKDLAKLLSREDIKYFMNIELGKAYSNPHLHVQVWSATSANLSNISKKICTKYNLNQNRCPITYQDEDSDIDVFHYVVKDYAKNLSDEEVWNLDVQKKRYRKQYGKTIRFYSKSSDRFTKRWYRFAYRYYGVLRSRADIFLESFLSIFSFWNKREIPKIRVFVNSFGNLCRYKKQVIVMLFDFVFEVKTACRSPPFKFLFINSDKRLDKGGVI
jgi:hypothetical protein